MVLREAEISDIATMHEIRVRVRENVLSDPTLITHNDYKTFMTEKGRGWVCEEKGTLLGFAVIDLHANNIWALFVDPESEGKGVGKMLHDHMLDWYFSQCKNTLWLSTSPGTRAEKFYRLAGWEEKGRYGNNEIKFEMPAEKWKIISRSE
jgi:GNAT superfamily N-acetyltransferase